MESYRRGWGRVRAAGCSRTELRRFHTRPLDLALAGHAGGLEVKEGRAGLDRL